jgi:hypothetical protein
MSAMIVLFYLLLTVVPALWAQDVESVITTRYTPSEQTFANPERGFYLYNNLMQLDAAIGKRREEGHTLIWGQIPLKAYRETATLPQAVLDSVSHGFAIARSQGMKVIVRGSYGSKGPGGDYTSYEDPPTAHIKNHMRQLAPVFKANADVIAFFEAGFVGPWGEWHTTKIANDYDQGRPLLFHLLEHTPAERMVLVRYPYFKQQIFKTAAGGYERVDASNAYSGSKVARVGHHNDCFLASPTDYGTYERGGQTREQETTYLATETLYTLFGGETCNPHELNDCQRALTELQTLHASYLNNGYHPKVLAKWKEQGCFDEVAQRLGARLVLEQSRVGRRAQRGKDLSIELTLTNRGFAALYNARDVEFVLHNEVNGAVYIFPQKIDPRAWKPGQEQHLKTKLNLPDDMDLGVYRLCLYLPDSSERLRADPRYAYRVANEGVWDAETGFNVLVEGVAIFR